MIVRIIVLAFLLAISGCASNVETRIKYVFIKPPASAVAVKPIIKPINMALYLQSNEAQREDMCFDTMEMYQDSLYIYELSREELVKWIDEQVLIYN